MSQTPQKKSKGGRKDDGLRPDCTSRDSFSPRLLLGLLSTLVAVAVLFAHWRVLSAQALSIDDSQYLTENHLVQHPSWSSAKRFLTEVLAPSTVDGYYQPLSMISLMLDCATGGSPKNLAPFHITSLALHAANTVMIILLLYRLIGNAWVAAMAGLLFGVHPMTVEPISWIGERKTVLSTFFALVSFLLYLRYVGAGRWKWYGLSLFAFVLGLMSKPTIVPLPLVLLALDYWPLRRLSGRTIIEKIPFLLFAGVFAVITVVSQRHVERVVTTAWSTGQTLLLMCHNLVFYPWKMIWPTHLSSFYAFPVPISLSNGVLLASVVLSGTILLVSLVSLRWTRALLVGWLFYSLLLSPTLLNKSYSPSVAWHKYAYLPAVGLLLVLAWLLARLWNDQPRMGKPIIRRLALGLIVLVLSGLEASATRGHLIYWRDSETLFQYMLCLAPKAPFLHNGFGITLVGQGKFDQAVEHFQVALRYQPNYPDARYNLGLALAQQGKFDQAIRYYRESLRHQPDDPEAHNNLAVALDSQGQLDEAIAHWENAVRLRPEYAEAQCNLGIALAKKRRFDEAIGHFRQAIGFKPDGLEAYVGLGDALAGQGRLDEAIGHYREALRLKPDYPEARYMLGHAFAKKGQLDEAIEQWHETLRLKPDSPLVYYNLAFAAGLQGKRDEAMRYYGEALRLDPRYVKAHLELGNVLAKEGKFAKAIGHYTEALRLGPASAEVHHNLGSALAELGKWDEAIEHYREALRLNPSLAPSHKGLGEALERQGKVDEAMQHYREALRLDPQDVELSKKLTKALTSHPE